MAYGIDRATYNMGQNAQFGLAIEEEVEPTMVAKGPGAVAHPVYTTSKNSYHTEAEEDVANTLVATDYKDPPTVTEKPYYIVRRLTPTECARLQGFPDWWCANLARRIRPMRSLLSGERSLKRTAES
ncbi:DNA (cytosine-5-)-methyltransferase [gut metagenome]|uniref:DNA (Cytosine-5-)-methyltransferase n=1 Tax=gut metagenome TaxID=749906 RepID=J9FUE2_9ZZZZ